MRAAFNYQGDAIASSDCDGVIKIWDMRVAGERSSIVAGSANQRIHEARFDVSGKRLISGSDGGVIKVFNLVDNKLLTELSGHEKAVNCVRFLPSEDAFVSAGADGTFRIWSR